MKINSLKVSDVKEMISKLKGQKVKMAVNKGRKHIVKFEAEVIATYPSVFTIETSENAPLKIQSYAYSEILCGNVRVQPLR